MGGLSHGILSVVQLLLSYICTSPFWYISILRRAYLRINILPYWLFADSHFGVQHVVVCPICDMEVAVRQPPPPILERNCVHH